jgi:tetratricopeptide (TPR) repeat protein
LALNPSKENSGRLIGGLSRKALVLHKLYRLDQAIEHYEQAFEMLDQRLAEAEESEQTKWIEMKIGMIFNAIMSYRAANDLEKVREVGSIGLQLCIDLKVRYPLVIRYSQEYARACGNYAESLWYAYLASPQDNQQTLEMAIDIFGKGAQQYRELSRLYPERNGFRGGAAIQYLRLSTALFWIGRQTEAETAFRKVLELSEQPEDIEPLHGPNALAVFTGYCMVIIKESTDQPLEHPFVNRFEKVLKVAEVALKDVKSPYVGRFLSEPLYQHFVGNEHFDRAYELASQTAKTIQQP